MAAEGRNSPFSGLGFFTHGRRSQRQDNMQTDLLARHPAMAQRLSWLAVLGISLSRLGHGRRPPIFLRLTDDECLPVLRRVMPFRITADFLEISISRCFLLPSRGLIIRRAGAFRFLRYESAPT
jgi:hypothetical protein